MGNTSRDPVLELFRLSFQPIKPQEFDSIETKLIHSIDMMHIKLLAKFQQKLLLSLEIMWENVACDPILG